MRSIKDNITEEVLLNEISEIIRLPLYADRIQGISRLTSIWSLHDASELTIKAKHVQFSGTYLKSKQD
jgi:hypothetical protein